MENDQFDDKPCALVDSAALSGELVALCTQFEGALFDWMERALAAQSPAGHVPLKVAVSEVAFALTGRLLYPTYRHHPQFIPPKLQIPSRRVEG